MTGRLVLARPLRWIGYVVPRSRRVAWLAEWTAEVAAEPSVPRADVLSGALRDAVLLRVGDFDQWAADCAVVSRTVARNPLGLALAASAATMSSTVMILLLICCESAVRVTTRGEAPPGTGALVLAATFVICALYWALRRIVRGAAPAEPELCTGRRRVLLAGVLTLVAAPGTISLERVGVHRLHQSVATAAAHVDFARAIGDQIARSQPVLPLAGVTTLFLLLYLSFPVDESA